MAARGEWLSLGALLLPWAVLSLLLPVAHMVAALGLLAALAGLLGVAARWSRGRAVELGLDEEAWGLAAVLSLGFAMALLLGTAGHTAFEAMCRECGKLQDARNGFCHGCGAYG